MAKCRVRLLIREWRRRKGVKLGELSRRTAIPPIQLCKYERGLTEPSLLRLWRISQALGVTIDVLYPPHDQMVTAVEALPAKELLHA